MSNPGLHYPRMLPGQRMCDRCWSPADPTEWLPGPGLDPKMVEFQCSKCRFKFFLVIENDHYRKVVGKRLLDLKSKRGFLHNIG